MAAPVIGTVAMLAMAAYYWYKFEQLSDRQSRLVSRIQQFKLLPFLRKTTSTNSAAVPSWVLTVIFALLPWGTSILDAHPCSAWACWGLATCSALFAIWTSLRIINGLKLVLSIGLLAGMAFEGNHSIKQKTQLDMFFVNPGAFLASGPDGKPAEWVFKATGEYTRTTLYHVQMLLQDEVTSNAIQAEKNDEKRLAMISSNSGSYSIMYPEVDTVFFSNPIIWKPSDINDQEYTIQAYYRVKDKQFYSNENIRIINVGTPVTIQDQSPKGLRWQFSVTVTNQVGETLMHCVDRQFPKDRRWIAGPVCFPGANYSPLPRSLCARCFGRGFEFFATT